ncbi:MAG: hypothetical protein PHH28_13480 [Desulfuromonadaceae bacterium]|nr:hypothetical protein [Desulfuromonadaceae bacterium]
MNRTPHEIAADALVKLYEAEFGSKPNGRYRVDRPTLATVYGRKNIEQRSIDQIALWLSEKYDFMLIDLHDEFAIIKQSIFRRYRKATNRFVEDYLGIQADDEDCNDEE